MEFQITFEHVMKLSEFTPENPIGGLGMILHNTKTDELVLIKSLNFNRKGRYVVTVNLRTQAIKYINLDQPYWYLVTIKNEDCDV